MYNARDGTTLASAPIASNGARQGGALGAGDVTRQDATSTIYGANPSLSPKVILSLAMSSIYRLECKATQLLVLLELEHECDYSRRLLSMTYHYNPMTSGHCIAQLRSSKMFLSLGLHLHLPLD